MYCILCTGYFRIGSGKSLGVIPLIKILKKVLITSKFFVDVKKAIDGLIKF